ncbi:MAG: hypothetical protein J3Q66DRAFT_350782 [Benniella sp.]|nr:MAG: hypothetical protein J3Q66DRAFT_350782 [Benniella sp.]
MLDIPELDQMVCRRLSPHDLAQCAQVSKKWWSIVTPHIWSDLSWLCSTTGPHKQLGAFYMMVLEDYHNRKRQRKPQAPTTTQPPPRSPILSKYGYWIRILPEPRDDRSPSPRTRIGQQKAQEASRLFIHLLNHCSPDVQVSRLTLHTKDVDLSPHHPRRTVLGLTLPRVRRLSIAVDFYSRNAEISNLMALLDQCSTILEKLQISVQIPPWCREGNKDKERAQDEPKCFPALKELNLRQCALFSTDAEEFWPWLWKRCGSVEKMVVDSCSVEEQSLSQSMMAYMPKLSEITLGKGLASYISDFMAAAVLSGSRNGWKKVRVGPYAFFERAAMDALATHTSTLEVLEINGEDFSINDLIEVLRSCTNLHTLSIKNTVLGPMGRRSSFKAEMFIDQDHNTDSLKAWKCESSLRVLHVHITDIPRPGQQSQRDEDNFSGQGRELQNKVYERLARFSNLETLQLGTRRRNWLGMSLGNGLEKLSGLKKLKKLGVRGMAMTRLGVKEAQWMTEHWPQLRTIVGSRDVIATEFVAWLRGNHPNVHVFIPRGV